MKARMLLLPTLGWPPASRLTRTCPLLAAILLGACGGSASQPGLADGGSPAAQEQADAAAGVAPGKLTTSPDAAASASNSAPCSKAADCAPQACATAACTTEGTGELTQGYCSYTHDDSESCVDAAPPAVDAGIVGQPPIDTACMGGGQLASVYPPYVPLVPPSVPASCSNGFELGDATPGSVFTMAATRAGGAAAITLDVDFATYLEPDGVVITGTLPGGATYALLDTCRLQTWTQGDPTGGRSRPPDQTIRQFRIDVQAGTTSLKVDFGGVVSPMYIQVLGLCDFDVAPVSAATFWQAVP